MSNYVYANCERLPAQTKYLDMDLGRVVVSPEVPVGGVITSKTWSFSGGDRFYKCPPGIHNFTAKILGNRVDTGGKIYSTNVKGIGLRMTRTGAVSMVYPANYKSTISTTTEYSLAGSSFTLEVIKTDQVTGAGILESGDYTIYDIEGGTDPILVTRLTGNSVTIISPSCNVTSGTNMNIGLGSVGTDDFNGVGSVAGGTNFNINLQCSGGVTAEGYANIKMTFSGQIPGTLTNSNGVLKNEKESDSRAKGIGIQISKDSNPIEFNKKYLLATLRSEETRSITVPLVAKYYQYEKDITAGQVESHMVFNLNYD